MFIRLNLNKAICMSAKLVLIFLLIVLLSISCYPLYQETIEDCCDRSTLLVSDKLRYDTTNIVILPLDSVYMKIPRDSCNVLQLTNDDLVFIDTILEKARINYNHTVSKEYMTAEYARFFDSVQFVDRNYIKSLKGYKRQYFPYIDTNGTRIVFINCFIYQGTSTKWREGYFPRCDGGNTIFRTLIRLESDSIPELYINGIG